jgi:hypothetical protein
MDVSYKLEKTLYLPAKDKLWGIIVSPTDMKSNRMYSFYSHFWCWWANPGKNLSIQKHKFNTTSIEVLNSKKIRNGYNPIDKEQLLEMWPDFFEQLHHKIIFEVLSKHE